jgi:hypothetical protein
MFIRSNIIGQIDIRNAMQHARSEGFDILIDEDGIREFKPRKFERGFQLYCEALSGPRARNGRPGKAASWDAYGVAMAYLYKLDPNAEVAWYKNARHFLDVTGRDVERFRAPGSGPWLTDGELCAVA